MNRHQLFLKYFFKIRFQYLVSNAIVVLDSNFVDRGKELCRNDFLDIDFFFFFHLYHLGCDTDALLFNGLLPTGV